MIILLVLIGIVACAVIPERFRSKSVICPSNISILKDEYTLYSTQYDLNTTGILLDHQDLVRNKLQDLHIPGSYFSLYSPDEKSPDSFFLPFNTRGLFLLEMEHPVIVSDNQLSMMMPFDFDGRYRLKNTQLLLPKRFLERYDIVPDSDSFNNTILKGAIYRNSMASLDFDMPLLIFHLEEDPDASRGASRLFFDMLTTSWIQSEDPLNIVHSIFCSLSKKSDAGACLRIDDDDKRLIVYPAYSSTNSKMLNYNAFFKPLLEKRENDQVNGTIFEFKDFDSNTPDDVSPSKVIPLLGIGLNNRQPPPRNPHYSQVIYPDLVHISVRSDESRCEPVTWANLFRRTLFGTKLCSEDV